MLFADAKSLFYLPAQHQQDERATITDPARKMYVKKQRCRARPFARQRQPTDQRGRCHGGQEKRASLICRARRLAA